MALEPGLAKAALGEAAAEGQEQQVPLQAPLQVPQQQQGKRAAGARRKSMAVAQQVEQRHRGERGGSFSVRAGASSVHQHFLCLPQYHASVSLVSLGVLSSRLSP